jgi:uncharacterized membrane protein
VIRGLVIIVMAIDHARDFWSPTAFQATDLDHTTALWFFTRWITHFCAPAFVFLAGTSAYFQFAKHGDKAKLSRFLLTRGLWLVVLDLRVIFPSWNAAPPYPFVLVQVLWAMGWSMMLLGLFIWLPDAIIALLAVLMVAGHDSFNGFQYGQAQWLGTLLHEKGALSWRGRNLCDRPRIGPRIGCQGIEKDQCFSTSRYGQLA